MLLATAAGVGGARADPVEGLWLTQPKNGIVEISRCADGALCGRLVWLRITPADNNPRAVDDRNPNPELRDRPLCGITMMWGFHPAGAATWSGGSIYDPQSGNTYQGTITLRPDGTLDLRGYVLISLLGRSETWTRFTAPIPQCPARG